MTKSKFGYDDSLDVVGVHGVGGIFGAIATGIFASKAILLVLKSVMGLRVTDEEERQGLDLSQHNESAYVFGPDYDEDMSVMSGHAAPLAKAATSKHAS